MDAENKRQSNRARLDVFVNKIVDEQLFMCRTADISPDGIYLSSLIEPELDGQRVGVEFALPGQPEVLWAAGEIVRDGLRGAARGSGIRFTALPDAYRQIIEAYVAECEGPRTLN
jgi:hypothetical protein